MTGAMALARYRPGALGDVLPTVHLVRLPHVEQAKVMTARCGFLLPYGQTETVAPGESIPCTMCLLHRSDDSLQSGGSRCPGLGRWVGRWLIPRDQVLLSLDREVNAGDTDRSDRSSGSGPGGRGSRPSPAPCRSVSPLVDR